MGAETKKKMGSPVIWTQERKEQAVDLICDMIMQGKSFAAIERETTREQTPSRKEFYFWIKENENFRNKYAHACDVRSDVIFEEIIEIADNETETDDNIIINRDKLRIDARKWIASKMNPKKYGDRIDVTTDGAAINNLTPIFGESPLKKLLSTDDDAE